MTEKDETLDDLFVEEPAEEEMHPRPLRPWERYSTSTTLLGLLGGVTVLLLLWALTFQLDVFSLAEGEVIPASKVKTVQHLEGGIVRRILVAEGDHVVKDQELMELEQTMTDAEVRRTGVLIQSLLIEIALLEAYVNGSPEPVFPEDLLRDHPELAQEADKLFADRKSQLEASLSALDQVVEQRVQRIEEVSARIRNDQEKSKLLDEQIVISQKLLAKELSNRYDHINLLKERQTLSGQMESDMAILDRYKAELKEAEQNKLEAQAKLMTDARQDMEKAKRELAENQEKLRKVQDSLTRTTVRAPVDGVIKTLYVVTEGGVVAPGGALFDIVPGADQLVIEAKLLPQDVGYVRPGLAAVVQLVSPDAARLGSIPGKVIHVSPDTVTDSTGTYYLVRVVTEKSYFGSGSDRYALVPGVIVSVGLHIGERSVFDYLVSPYTATSNWRLSER